MRFPVSTFALSAVSLLSSVVTAYPNPGIYMPVHVSYQELDLKRITLQDMSLAVLMCTTPASVATPQGHTSCFVSAITGHFVLDHQLTMILYSYWVRARSRFWTS